MSLNTTTEIKKEQNIRIKDLCPEEKRKIGELLKKLSNETEEKEKLQTMLQEDKKLYEEKIKTLETSLLQQSMMSTSNFNFNDLKAENCRQFSIERTPKKEEKIIKNKLKEKNLSEKLNENNNSNNINSTAATLNDIRNLKARFNSMFDKIKKANEINDTIIQKVEQEDMKNDDELNNIKNNNLDEKEEEPEKILPPSPTKQDSFYNDNYNINENDNDNDEYIYPNPKNNFDKSFLSNNEEFLNNLNSISSINNNNTFMMRNNDLDKNDNNHSRSKSKGKGKNIKIRKSKNSYNNGINNIKVQQINKKFGSNYKEMLSKAKLKFKEQYDNEILNENIKSNSNDNNENNDLCNINK